MNVSYFKAIIFGEPKCGKQSLISKLSNDKGQLVIEDKAINSQYIFEFQINNMEPDSDSLCFIYVVDLTKNNSLDNIESIENIPIKNVSILIGNKLDLDNQRKIDQDDMQTYAVDNGMLVQEISCINNGTNIDSLIRQISNKAKFLLKNQSKDKKPAITNKSPHTNRENMMNQKSQDKLQESTNVEASQTNKTSNILSSQINSSNRNSILNNTSQANQNLNSSKVNQSLSKPLSKPSDIKRDSHIDKNRQSTGDNESSISPAKKKFDVKDKLKQFTKKRDNSNEDERPLPPQPVEQKQEENKILGSKVQQIDFSKGKGIESQKLEPKIQPSKSSQLKKNSINGELQLSQTNSRNSFSSNKQMTSSKRSIPDGSDLKASIISNKSGVHNLKDDDKRNNLISSQQSQRSEQNNNNANILESMYKNKISNQNKLPPTTQQAKQIQENKSQIKSAQDDPSEVKRKLSANSNLNSNKHKETTIEIKNKNAINSINTSTASINPKDNKDNEQKNKFSTSDFLKLKQSTTLSTSQNTQKQLPEQNSLKNTNQNQTDTIIYQDESKINKDKLNANINESQKFKNQNDLEDKKRLSVSIESNKVDHIRKNSWKNEQNVIQKQDKVDDKDQIDEDEDGNENDGRILPTPQINVLQCSSIKEKGQQNNKNSPQKSSNSLNEYLENENLLNNQDELLALLVQQPISSDKKQLIDSEYVPVVAEQQLQNNHYNQEQIPKIGMITKNGHKFVKSDYLEDKPIVNRTFNTQITNQFLENILLNMPEQNQQNIFHESTILNKQMNNNEFYRQSFEDVPNIMNPSSNDSSMVFRSKQDEIITNENIDIKEQQILEQSKILSKHSSKNLIVNQNNQYNFSQGVNQQKQNEPDFNSFNLKDPESVHQFSLSKQQYSPQTSQQYQENQSIEQNQYPQLNLIQYQSFQDKQGMTQEQIPQSHNNSEQQSQQQSQQQVIQYLQNMQTGPQQQQQIPQLMNFNTNDTNKQLTLQQMNQQGIQFSQNNIQKQFNQSLNIQTQDFANQFGSYVNTGSNGQTLQHLSSQQVQPQNQLEQEFLLQQLIQQMQSNQNNKQNPQFEQLAKQLLLNQQYNSFNGQNNLQKNMQQIQNEIPSQFSFTNNQLNRQQNQYNDNLIQQQNNQNISQSPNNFLPFNIQQGANLNNNAQLQQNFMNEHSSLSSSNGQNQNLNKFNQLNSNNQTHQQGVRQTMQDNSQFPIHSSIQQNHLYDKNIEESIRASSKLNNESEQDGKVSRFSIHTMNKTPEPTNTSGVNNCYVENNQQKDNSILIADVEQRQNNQSGLKQRQFSPAKINYLFNSNDPNGFIKTQSPYSDERKNQLNMDGNFYSRQSEEGNYPQFGGRGNHDNRGRNPNPNSYYQEQYNINSSDRQFTSGNDKERGFLQKREYTEGGLRKSQQDLDYNKYHQTNQARDFSNSSHIDDLLRESSRRNKQEGQSTSQSLIKSHRGRMSQNQYNDTSLQQYQGHNNVNTSNILLNISSNMIEKSFDDTSELTQLDKNIKALEESIEDIDIDLRQGRIQQKIKSRRDYSNNQNKDMDISAPLLDVSGNGYSGTQTLRSRSQNEKVSNLEKTNCQKQILNQFASSGEEISYNKKNNKQICLKNSESNVPIYETTLLSSKRSPKKDDIHEEIQLTLGKPQPQPFLQKNGRLLTKENAEIVAEIALDQNESDREDIYSMICVDISQDCAAQTQMHSSRPTQQNFHSKKSKSLLMLNIEYEHQKLSIDIYGDDTSFSVAERFFTSLNKTASRNQIKKLSQIIERIINKYCSDLEEVVEKIEQKKLKERDTLECFIREKNFMQNNQQYNNTDLNQVLRTSRNISNNTNRQGKEIIGKIKIDYNKRQLFLIIKENDDAHDLAFNFITQNNLPKNKISYIVEQISQIQQIQQQKKSADLQPHRSNNPNSNLDIHYSPTHQGIGRQYGQQINQSNNTTFISSPTKNDKRDKPLLFNIKFDLGNGKYIHLSVHSGDNLKKLAFNASQNYKLSHEQYLKVYECLDKTYRIKRECSWTNVYNNK